MKGVIKIKIAVSSNGKSLDSQVDPRFGRCNYFVIVNPGDMSSETLDNECAVLRSGAGIRTAQSQASQVVVAVISDNCGPNAVQTLSVAGVELYGGQAGTVRKIVDRFKLAIS